MNRQRLVIHRQRIPGQAGRVGVSITDRATGMRYIVVPVEVAGRARLSFISIDKPNFSRDIGNLAREMIGAEPTPVAEEEWLEGPFLNHDRLAVIALAHLRAYPAEKPIAFVSQGRPADIVDAERPRGHRVDVRRPIDEELLAWLRTAADNGDSMRQTLADVYGAALTTCDDWIRYARSLPGGADLPPARRGRPPGRKNINHTRRGE
jgi:hypothetical protein